MNGVTELSSKIIYNTILPEYWIGIGLGFAIVFSVAAIVLMAIYERTFLSIVCFVLTVGAAVAASLGGTYSKTDIDYIELKVTIDDSVSMNEFHDKYEILETEGKIYTVKERE